MNDHLPVAPVDERIARDVLVRNIRNSADVIAGDFESVLADIIEQLANPPSDRHGPLPASDMTRRIARALREGFAGLPPNGFDFCVWLWSVAPLHDVPIASANDIGTSRGFRYGVVHLRKIAAMVSALYVDEQPQKVESVVPLIDASIDWVDARDLIIHALLGYYERFFEQEFAALLDVARGERRWRRLIPAGVAARMIVVDPSWTAMALSLVSASVRHLDDEHVHRAVAYAIRSAVMYGDSAALTTFITRHADDAPSALRSLIGDSLRISKRTWTAEFLNAVLPVLDRWIEGSADDDTSVTGARDRLAP